MKPDFYAILGVLPTAKDVVIRAAYRALSQRYHPDKWNGDRIEATRLMQKLNEAYDVLSNVERFCVAKV
jgi:curved DNA-binding protein CbpA